MSLQYGNVVPINDPRLAGLEGKFRFESGKPYTTFTNWNGNYAPKGARMKLMSGEVKVDMPMSAVRNWNVRQGLSSPKTRKNRKNRKTRKNRRSTRSNRRN